MKKIDAASLGIYRFLFGAAMALQVIDYLVSGKIIKEYIAPKMHLSYPLLPLPTFSPEVTYGIFIAMLFLACCIAAGYRYRVTAPLFFLGYTWIFFLDQTFFLNHYYAIWLLSGLLIVTHCDRFLAIDQYRNPKSTEIPMWHLYLFRFQIAIVYIFAAVEKLNYDWMFRGEPVRMWLPYFPESIIQILVWGGIFFNALIIPGLLWKKTRPYAFIVAVMFHVSNSIMFSIGIFPWMMIVATTLFLDPSWPRRFVQESSISSMPSISSLLLILYCFIQIALPLRHFTYPGDVSWTEEGRTFAWQMKVRDKKSELTLTASGENGTYTVNPYQYLSKHQWNRVKERPDLIRQFANQIAGENEAIYADSMVSLNGKPAKRMMDPNENLVIKGK
ncbi:MAG: HTTM domain-containing protein [Candidatus Peribacteraceae bacterium]|nr:HTTM domain-containing protein [Candidatus Peribacteraceae bacterium]